jgi:hypothetical protein
VIVVNTSDQVVDFLLLSEPTSFGFEAEGIFGFSLLHFEKINLSEEKFTTCELKGSVNKTVWLDGVQLHELWCDTLTQILQYCRKGQI